MNFIKNKLFEVEKRNNVTLSHEFKRNGERERREIVFLTIP
jgi:hypothetical protein